jgi:hypothetical protein
MENQTKYLLLARQAREENNAEDARKYYDMVRADDPSNPEAKFYYTYYRLLDGKKGEALNQFINLGNSLAPIVKLINQYDYSKEDKELLLKDIIDCVKSANRITSDVLRDIGKQGADADLVSAKSLYSYGCAIQEIFGNDPSMIDIAVLAWDTARTGIKYYSTGIGTISEYKAVYDSCKDKISSISPELAQKMIDSEKSVVQLNREKILGLYAKGDELEKNGASKEDMLKIAVPAWKEGIELQQKYYNCVTDKSLPAKYAEKIKKFEPAYEMPQAKMSPIGKLIGKIMEIVDKIKNKK